jgi:hypothetical protein
MTWPSLFHAYAFAVRIDASPFERLPVTVLLRHRSLGRERLTGIPLAL